MSQFQGSNTRVRCIDCARLDGNTCLAKRGTVAPKKRRTCGQYQFKGEYVNRTSAEGIYIPPVDKKTKRMINKLLRLGIVPVSGNSQPVVLGPDGVPMERRTVQVPGTTATAKLLRYTESPPSADLAGGVPDDPSWTPNTPEQ